MSQTRTTYRVIIPGPQGHWIIAESMDLDSDDEATQWLSRRWIGALAQLQRQNSGGPFPDLWIAVATVSQ